MQRLTTMGPDGQPVMIGGVGLPELIERLWQFEEAVERMEVEADGDNDRK